MVNLSKKNLLAEDLTMMAF